jgi:WD40 repeat protein
VTSLRSTFLVAVVVLCVQVSVAAEPSDDDPLPKGAKLRLGSDRLTYRAVSGAALLPPDYKTFLIADRPLGFRRYDAITGKALDDSKGGGGYGGQVVVSGDGKRAVLVHTGILTVRDATTGKALGELKPPAGFGTFANSAGPHVSLSGDGKVAAQGVTNPQGNKGTVLVWDVDNSKILAQFEVLQKGGPLPVLSADGTVLATRGTTTTPYIPPGEKDDDSGRTIQVWDVGAKKELFRARVTPGGSSITACAFSADGTLLAASCSDGPVDLWDAKTGKLKATLLGRSGQGVRVCFSPDGKTLAAVGTDGAIQRWATADGKPLGTTAPPAQLLNHTTHGLAFVNNERVVAWGAAGPMAAAWEAPSGKFLRPPGAHTHTTGVSSIGFAAGGKQIVTAGWDDHVVRWDAATGKPLGTMEFHPSRPANVLRSHLALSLSPDAARVLASSNAPAVFDPTTGEELFAVPRGPTNGFNISSRLSADGTRAIVVTSPFDTLRNPNGTATVWDLVERKKIGAVEFPVATGNYPVAALSPSGNRLIVARYAKSANAAQTVLVVTGFDLKTGKKLNDVEDHTANGGLSVTAASETSALVGSGTGRLRLFNYEDGRGGDEIEPVKNGDPGGPVVFSPDGKRFAVGVLTDEPNVFGARVFAWPSAKPVHTFGGHRGPISALTFSPDGKTLASGSHDTTVLLWDMDAIPAPK